MSGSITGTATGVISPGDVANLDLSALENFLRCVELLRTGDFRVKASSDGLTFSNVTSIIDNTTNTTPGFLNDDSAPAYARVAGSLANVGALVVIAPDAGYAQQFECCVQVVGGSTTNVQLRITVAFGGFAAIAVAGQCPEPITAGDQRTRLGGGTNALPTGVTVLTSNGRANGWVTSGPNTEPAFGITFHARGTDNLEFAFICDYRIDGSGSALDASPYAVHVSGANGLTQGTLFGGDPDVANNSVFACKFGSGLTTGCHAIGLLTAAGQFAQAGGANTLDAKESLFPLIYFRTATWPLTQGGGNKGVSRYFTWQSIPHALGDHGNEAGAATKERVAFNNVFLPWAFPAIACIR